MTKRKNSSSRKNVKKTRKAKAPNAPFHKILWGLTFLVFLVIGAGVLAHHMLMRKAPVDRHIIKPPAPAKTHNIQPKTNVLPEQIPPYEIYPSKRIPSQPRSEPDIAPHGEKQLPKIAIIIDDLGYDRRLSESFVDLDPNLTLSFLPFSPYQKRIADTALRKGREVMIHVPMEPEEFPEINPGPGALLTNMSPDELISQLEKNIQTLPFAVGINNHMGSKLTRISSQMNQIMSILKKRGLFYIDSYTTAESACRSSARLLRVPFARRDIFIDHVEHPDHIEKQLKRLMEVAADHRQAIGIAHPHETTLQVLKKYLPLLKKNFQLVPVSKLVHVVG